MGWKEPVNSLLTRAIGYQLTRPPGHKGHRLPAPDNARMLTSPIFIFSPARSGSTLLRAVLGSHTELYAPPELPLMHMRVKAESKWIERSLRALQFTKDDLDHMLWDQVLADILERSSKSRIVVKTPSNVLIWSRIAEIWPDAQFIFLIRHPAAVVASLQASWDPDWQWAGTGTSNKVTASALRYMRKVEEARRGLKGHTVRYEDVTGDPETTIRKLCGFLKMEYQPDMLEYGQFADFQVATGLGDASKNIRSGRIQPGTPPPDNVEIPEALAQMCATWGYRQPNGKPYASTGSAEWDAAGVPLTDAELVSEDAEEGVIGRNDDKPIREAQTADSGATREM
jgi:Sulfotransferase family